MADYIEKDAVISLIEEQQKALCPVGRYGRHYVYGSDREKYDAWDEIIDSIDAIPVVELPDEFPNVPLTLEELREMGGEPVWIESTYSKGGCGWCLVDSDGDVYNDRYSYYGDCYGETWLAYRRKPEE